ncbi:MAG: DUF3667 domain-containing protein [Bacteroidales bacterium]|nr:DUF3667 domain-containing protein [Bacteroidales bacterium]
MMSKKRLLARLRAFTIWQKLGFMPWSRRKSKSRKGDFYKGAFDNIPFLNDDAKRTFVHLLLRPGYMIRDYIKGQHERYLAPLTSLIIFYAFFALVSSIVNPDFSKDNKTSRDLGNETTIERTIEDSDEESEPVDPSDSLGTSKNEVVVRKVIKVVDFYNLLILDKHPELVDSPAKASLAAFESSMRSQGVHLFLTNFLFLWFAMCLALRKKGMGISACAAAAAYVLCQFCFFMFFSLFLSGDKGEIGVGLMGLLLMLDYCQLFDLNWKKSLKLTIKTGLCYLLAAAVLLILSAGIIYLSVSAA